MGGAFDDSKLQTLSFLSSFSNSFKKNVRTPVSTHSGDTMAVFTFSPLDFVFSCLGLPLFLADVVLDVLAVIDFYKEEAWVRLSVLLLLLVGSSVLIQVYSWKWYIADGLDLKTRVESALKKGLKTLHVLQLGIYVRWVTRTSFAFCWDPRGGTSVQMTGEGAANIR